SIRARLTNEDFPDPHGPRTPTTTPCEASWRRISDANALAGALRPNRSSSTRLIGLSPRITNPQDCRTTLRVSHHPHDMPVASCYLDSLLDRDSRLGGPKRLSKRESLIGREGCGRRVVDLDDRPE